MLAVWNLLPSFKRVQNCRVARYISQDPPALQEKMLAQTANPVAKLAQALEGSKSGLLIVSCVEPWQ